MLRGKRQAGRLRCANLNICENLYGLGQTAVTNPHYTYAHADPVVPGEACGTGSSSVAGMAFYQGGPYPSSYDGALFFADYSRECIWVMEKGANGLPDPTKRSTFVAGAAGPVDLEIGPGGDLFYADIVSGTIRRVEHFAANQPPVARATASPIGGPAPLTVSFDGTASRDPEGDALSYEWDLDGDGAYDDSSEPRPSRTYSGGSYQVGLRVTDGQGASDTLDQALTISAGNTQPTAAISAPSSTTTWKVGDRINFSGFATDEQEGQLPAARLSWSLIMHHCPSDCHEHPEQNFAGVASGSFVTPDHEYPSYLELRLTATDSSGLTDTESVRLDPETVALSFRSNPAGLRLAVGDGQATAPFSRTVIVGSTNSISAPTPQTLAGTVYEFASWSDGGAQTHNVVAGAEPGTFTATYGTAVCTVTGTSANETLTGTPGNDVICAGAGNDVLRGLEGNDILEGEGGADKLSGETGDDTLDGGKGTDTAQYSGSLTGISASLTTGSATGEGSDNFLGVENLVGSPQADALTGSGANDNLNGGSGADTLSGQQGADKLTGAGSNDTLRGESGNDTVVGSGGADQLFGDDGDDTVNSRDGVSGNDTLNGGSGTDTKTTDATEKTIVGFP